MEFPEAPDEFDALMMPAPRAVGLWLAAGYCYEFGDFELIPDQVWHVLCRRLLDEFDALEHGLGHHKLLDRAALECGSCAYLRREDYPARARGFASAAAFAWHGRELPYEITKVDSEFAETE